MFVELPLLIIGMYLAVFVAIAFYEARGGISRSPEDFFLAGRKLGTLVLLFTILATIQSGWSFFGGPGFAYSHGFGTAVNGVANLFAAVVAYFIGMRLWKISRENDLISPVEYMKKRTESDLVALTFLTICVVLVIPYIAIQPMAGGIIFNVITGGSMTTQAGALLTIAIMTAYVLIAGMRGVAWTDTVQAIIMMTVLVIGLVVLVGSTSGSFGELGVEITSNPDHFSTPGPTGFWTSMEYFSWMLFMALGTAVFPQVLVRYMAAERASTLKRSIFLYGAIAAVLHFFLLPFLGSLGALSYVGLERPDEIFVVIVQDLFGVTAGAVILGGALSAMISTADSQMLMLSQLLSRDLYKEHLNPDAEPERETRIGRGIIIVLGMIAGAISLYEPEFIFLIGEVLFTGFAVTAIPLMAALYWKNVTAKGILASLAVGETLAVILLFDIVALPFDIHPSLPALAVTAVLVVAVSLVTEPPSESAVQAYGTP